MLALSCESSMLSLPRRVANISDDKLKCKLCLALAEWIQARLMHSKPRVCAGRRGACNWLDSNYCRLANCHVGIACIVLLYETVLKSVVLLDELADVLRSLGIDALGCQQHVKQL